MTNRITCPECKGYGSESATYDIEEYCPCALCDGDGVVPEGTKTWLERLLLHKED